ncbi:MarR family transcriptional regulator [Oxyplasma meridianum]|uniref:MarR family transcriptional regulator n=1 Tax=Oxyplasma meridianum TaxID=3073602 RepID=A0AAX4NH79_9ARCH
MAENKNTDSIEVWRTFLETWKVWKKGVDRNLQTMGLGSTEYSILRHLFEDGKMPMVQMANLIMVTPGWITGLIDTMEKNGLVKRVRNTEDRRIIDLVITEAGIHLFKKAKSHHTEYIAMSLEKMNAESLSRLKVLLDDLKDSIVETCSIKADE